MIGVYIASKIKANINWNMGQEVPMEARNLSLPAELLARWSNHSGLSVVGAAHLYAEPLGHLYYTLSEGTPTNVGLGTEEALAIFLDAILVLGEHPSLLEFIETTVELVDMRYGGVCSDESRAIRHAWDIVFAQNAINTAGLNEEELLINELIIGYGVYSCAFSIYGFSSFCEESNFANFSISSGLPNAQYKWTLTGKYASEFKMTGNGGTQNGNIFKYSSHLYLSDFPNLPYYPQFYKLRVYNHLTGKVAEKRFRLDDCDGDDLTCHDYYNPMGGGLPNTTSAKSEIVDLDRTEIDMIFAYDLQGKMIYKGREIKQVYKNGIIIFAYYNKKGKLLKVEKKLNFNQ